MLFNKDGSTLKIKNYHYSQTLYQASALQAGFTAFNVYPLQLPSGLLSKEMTVLWKNYLQKPVSVVIAAKKPEDSLRFC